MVSLESPPRCGSSYQFDAAAIVSATYHSSTGLLSVGWVDANQVTQHTLLSGQPAVELFAALQSLANGTYTTTT
jgi:hypothetical protein